MGWTHVVGILPHKVVVFEDLHRKGDLYLRWQDPAKKSWRYQKIGRGFVDDRGRALAGRARRDAETAAIAAAEAKYAENKAGGPTVAAPAEPERSPLTLLEGWARITDPEQGTHPVDDYYRRDLWRALENAVRVLGDVTWVSLRRADYVRFWRRRMAEVREAAGAEVEARTGLSTALHEVERVLTIGRALAKLEHVPVGTAELARGWKEDLRQDFAKLHGAGQVPEPHRPRHTVAELRQLLTAAAAIDPRLALLLQLGAGLRPGQVLRATRADLDLMVPPHGQLTVRGRGKKGGTVVLLTRGMAAAVRLALGITAPDLGYLRALERAYQQQDVADYPLFPGGALVTVGRWTRRTNRQEMAPKASAVPQGLYSLSTATKDFHDAERRAGIVVTEGRGMYGLRRALVDAATEEGVSPEALQQLGGWTDVKTPNAIYRNQAVILGQQEALEARAKILGEDPAAPTAEAAD